MPILICLAGGLFGGVMSAIAWRLLDMLLWVPYWESLSSLGMTSNSVGWAFGSVLVPSMIGFLFVLSTVASIFMAQTFYAAQRSRWIAVAINVVPGLLGIAQGAGMRLQEGVWEYPGFEVAVVLIGVCWGLIFSRIALARRRNFGLA